MIKNPPANAGDTGSSPGPGRSHIKKKQKKTTFIYLFIWPRWVLVAAHGIFIAALGSLVAACGIWFPDQGPNLGPLPWEHGVLATGPPGKSLRPLFLISLFLISWCLVALKFPDPMVLFPTLLPEAWGSW